MILLLGVRRGSVIYEGKQEMKEGKKNLFKIRGAFFGS